LSSTARTSHSEPEAGSMGTALSSMVTGRSYGIIWPAVISP
jgi:hypothetical protein